MASSLLQIYEAKIEKHIRFVLLAYEHEINCGTSMKKFAANITQFLMSIVMILRSDILNMCLTQKGQNQDVEN